MLDNPVWQHDPLAWRVFEYLLIRAYEGKPQGTVVTSRYQIAERVFGNNNTIYKALKRLEKYEMVTISATNKKTVINICNWSKYQYDGNQSGNNKVTTNEQQSNTLIRIKNKELRNKTDVPVPLKEIINLYSEHRAKLKAPLSDHAIKLTLNKLERLSPNDYQTQISIVEQSIERGWKGVFALSDKKEESKGWF